MTIPKKMSPMTLGDFFREVHAALGWSAADALRDHLAALEQELADARKEHEKDQTAIRVWGDKTARAEAGRDYWEAESERLLRLMEHPLHDWEAPIFVVRDESGYVAQSDVIKEEVRAKTRGEAILIMSAMMLRALGKKADERLEAALGEVEILKIQLTVAGSEWLALQKALGFPDDGMARSVLDVRDAAVVLQEEHREALARARSKGRNAGLERAAHEADVNGLHVLAEQIRAFMEPES